MHSVLQTNQVSFMKRILLFLLLATSVSAMAQKTVNIGVIPTPQRVEMHNGVCAIGSKQYYYEIHDSAYVAKNPKKHRQSVADDGTSSIIKYYRTVDRIEGAENQREAYRIEVLPDRIIITSTTDEGRRWANQTLFQMRGHYRDSIPCMTVTDWPAYQWRGWMDDISRGPITNSYFAGEQKSLLSRVKMNYYTYYTEHTLYNRDYPDLVPPDFPRFAANRSLMANLQCFGHFEETLKIPFYDDIKDSPFNIDPSKEKSYDFLRSQIANTLKMYPNALFFNINCDETESLGSGHAKDYVEQHGADQVYCQHINRVYDIVQDEYRKQYPHDDGLEVLMWGDIVAKNPAMLKRLPREMNYIVWAYTAQESYDNMIAPFRKLYEEQGSPFWVAPGVSHWSSTPQVHNYIRNIAHLARDGHRAGARGLMNTAWDDSGESLFGDSWHAMFWAAEMAWHPLTETDPKKAEAELAERERIFNEIYNEQFVDNFIHGWECGTGRAFPDRNPKRYTDMIYAVGDLNHDADVGDWFNTSALMLPLFDFYPTYVDSATLGRCSRVDDKVRRVLATIDSSALPHFAYACHRILTVSEKSRLRVLLYRILQESDVSVIPEARELADRYFSDLHNLKREYLRLWDLEAGAYCRDVVCDRYDLLGREAMEAFDHIVIDVRKFKDGSLKLMLSKINPDNKIHYTLDGEKPNEGSPDYKKPINIVQSGLVRAVTFNRWGDRIESQRYITMHKGVGNLKKLNSRYSDYNAAYSGGGDQALADATLADDLNYKDGHWQGYWGQDIDVEYDFGKKQPIERISMRFLQNSTDWILAPQRIEVYSSKDGKKWQLMFIFESDPDFRESGNIVRTDAIPTPGLKTRYLRIVAKNPGTLPSWHMSAGQPSYLFTDEIVIK